MHPLCTLAASGRISPTPMPAQLSSADKRTGIYCIWMPADPKHRVYVGQAGRGLTTRFNGHRVSLRKCAHHTVQLQRAYTKYGESAFVWALVEEVPRDVEALTAAEQAWMDIAGRARLFNTAPAAGSPLGVRHTVETRAKVAAAGRGRVHTAETKAKISAAQVGKVIPPEARAKMSAARTGTKLSAAARAAASARLTGVPKSAEHREKIRTALLNHVRTAEHAAKLTVGRLGRARSSEARTAQSAAWRSRTAEQNAATQAKRRATLAANAAARLAAAQA